MAARSYDVDFDAADGIVQLVGGGTSTGKRAVLLRCDTSAAAVTIGGSADDANFPIPSDGTIVPVSLHGTDQIWADTDTDSTVIHVFCPSFSESV